MSKLFLTFLTSLMLLSNVVACIGEMDVTGDCAVTRINDLYYRIRNTWWFPAKDIDYTRSDFYWFYEISKDGATWVKYLDIATTPVYVYAWSEGSAANGWSKISGTDWYLYISNMSQLSLYPYRNGIFPVFYQVPADINDYKYGRIQWQGTWYNFELVDNPDADKFPAFHMETTNVGRLITLNMPWNGFSYIAEVAYKSRQKILPFTITVNQASISLLPVVAGPTANGQLSPDGLLIGNFPITSIDGVVQPVPVKPIALDSPIVNYAVPPTGSRLPTQARLEYSLVDPVAKTYSSAWITVKTNDHPPVRMQGYLFGKSPLSGSTLTVGDYVVFRSYVTDGINETVDQDDHDPGDSYTVYTMPQVYHIVAPTGPKFKK